MTALVWTKLFHTLMGIPVRKFKKVYFDKKNQQTIKSMQISQQVRVKIFLHSSSVNKQGYSDCEVIICSATKFKI